MCRWPVRLVLTGHGQRLYVDPAPNELGTVVRLHLPDHRIRARILTGDEMPWLGPVNADVGPFVRHVRTCGRHGRPKPQPPCVDCGRELHPIITARGGRRHWLCGPDAAPADIRSALQPAAPAPVQTELEEAS